MNIKTTEICPSCGGSGKIAPSILIADQVERDLDFLLSKQNEKQITISMHPYLHAYFTKGIYSKKIQWYFKYFRKINILQDSSLGISDYVFTNKLGEQIEL
jgi:ribonuclease G